MRHRCTSTANMDWYARPAQGPDNREERARLRRLLYLGIDRCLTPRQREMLLLHCQEELTMVEIGARLGVNVSTVSRTLKAARKKLEQFADTAGLVKACG